ncbi:MAG TPA: hypothetical protein VGC81_16300 [Candidatus Methylomirabilis sp.]
MAKNTDQYDGGEKPMFRDYRSEGAEFGLGRKAFRRLRSAGAFDTGSNLRTYNPFLEEGQANWEDNPLSRFSGPARQRMSNHNLMGAIDDILGKERDASMGAYGEMKDVLMGNLGPLNEAGTAVSNALKTPAVDAATLASWQAQARERIGREAGLNRASLSAQLAGSGMRQDPLNASQAAFTGDALYRTGQAEIDQGFKASEMNRSALMEAISAAGGYTGNIAQVIDSLLSIEGFRSSLSEDEVNALIALRGLKAAG